MSFIVSSWVHMLQNIWQPSFERLFLQHYFPRKWTTVLKTTGTVPCCDILLNSIHLTFTWYVSFHHALTCFHSFFAVSFTLVLPPSLPPFGSGSGPGLHSISSHTARGGFSPLYFVLSSDRYLPTRLHGCRVKWNFILSFMGVFLGRARE